MTMNQSYQPPTPPQGSRAISLLRIILWLVPAGVLPFAIALGGAVYPLWPAGVIAGLAAFAAIGYFDQRLRLQQERKDPTTVKRELLRRTVIFVILQLLIAPAICFTALYGFCLFAGMGY